jgi:hypothetical protein
MKIDGIGLLLGETNDQAWLELDHASVVIDKSTGCAIESYATPPVLLNLPPVSGEEILASADVLKGIREVVGLGRRFKGQHHRFVLDMVWSPNGRHIVVDIHKGGLYRSSDGGQTFELLDGVSGTSRPAMSPDGKHLVYQRCGNRGLCEYVSAALDGSRKPVRLTSGNTFLLKMIEGESSVYFWRTTMPSVGVGGGGNIGPPETCLDKFDLKSGARTSTLCQPLPATVVGPWPAQHWVDVSPNGKWGIVHWEEHRKNLAGVPALTYIVSLVDLTTPKGQIVKTVLDVDGVVDDEGNMVVHSMNEGGGDHTYFYSKASGQKKLVGNHSLMSYTNKVVMMHVHTSGSTLGAQKCNIVKLVKP